MYMFYGILKHQFRWVLEKIKKNLYLNFKKSCLGLTEVCTFPVYGTPGSAIDACHFIFDTNSLPNNTGQAGVKFQDTLSNTATALVIG